MLQDVNTSAENVCETVMQSDNQNAYWRVTICSCQAWLPEVIPFTRVSFERYEYVIKKFRLH